MNKKLALLSIVIIISLASIGISYSGDTYIEFIQCVASDNDGDPGVGSVDAQINNGDELIVSISNGYPGYEAYVDFEIQNTNETDDAYVTDISISKPNDLNIAITGISVGDHIPPKGIISGNMTVKILQTAIMDSTYDFSVSFSFSNVAPSLVNLFLTTCL